MATQLEQLKDLISENEPDETENTKKDASAFRNHSKKISLTVGYLLGVREEHLKILFGEEQQEYTSLIESIQKNEAALIIRTLNNLRSNMMLGFKEISRQTRVTASDFKPMDKVEMLAEDFKTLSRLDMDITTGRNDINEYLKKINTEITKRIDQIKPLFPEWLNFNHIKLMFKMPNAIENESKKFQSHQSNYPYKRYFFWKNPTDEGNILSYDEKLLDILYDNGGEYFTESNRVIDASDLVKNSIHDFLQKGNKIQYFIDGENTDPYCFAASLDSLSDEELEKIDRIVIYYDSKYSVKAWQLLKHFSAGIEVEAVGVERLIDEKSLVDHMLVAGVAKAVYDEHVDSVILVSSDSDFWSVIKTIPARYLVMVEEEKCSHEFKEVLRENGVFYCYTDRFMISEENEFFKLVFKKELQKAVSEAFKSVEVNANELFSTAIRESRADISPQEKENLIKKYIQGLKVDIDKEGKISILVP